MPWKNILIGRKKNVARKNNKKPKINNIIVLSGNVVRINKMPRKKYKKCTCKKNQRDCGTKF